MSTVSSPTVPPGPYGHYVRRMKSATKKRVACAICTYSPRLNGSCGTGRASSSISSSRKKLTTILCERGSQVRSTLALNSCRSIDGNSGKIISRMSPVGIKTRRGEGTARNVGPCRRKQRTSWTPWRRV